MLNVKKMVCMLLLLAFSVTASAATDKAVEATKAAVKGSTEVTAPAKKEATPKEAPVAGSVNINKASAEEIAAVLTGVGDKKAAGIVADRKANGAFKSVDDLARVKGIGPATIDKNRSKIKLK